MCSFVLTTPLGSCLCQVRRLRLTLGDRAANAVLSGKALRPGDDAAARTFEDAASTIDPDSDEDAFTAEGNVDAAVTGIDRPRVTSVNTSAFSGACVVCGLWFVVQQ